MQELHQTQSEEVSQSDWVRLPDWETRQKQPLKGQSQMGGVEFWIHHPDFQLIQPADPNATQWCPESVEMVEWGDTLISRVAADPAPGKIAFAQTNC